MKYDSERAVKAVLDNFQIESCSLVGISLGGYLAPRAAAFEPRVKRVVAWGAMHDFTASLRAARGDRAGNVLFGMVRRGFRKIINSQVKRLMAVDAKAKWSIVHGMHTSGQRDPYGFLKWMLDFNLDAVAHKIKQDTLLISGNKDHLVPVEQLLVQAKSLTSATSVTTRLVTEYEHGAEHCQIGNPDLVVNEILLWLEGLDRRDLSLQL